MTVSDEEKSRRVADRRTACAESGRLLAGWNLCGGAEFVSTRSAVGDIVVTIDHATGVADTLRNRSCWSTGRELNPRILVLQMRHNLYFHVLM